MAKKTTSRAEGAKDKAAKPKKKAAKAATKKRVAPRETAQPSQSSGPNAADALVKLIESPLVADLLAVGATAALAAVAENRFSHKDERTPAKASLKKAASAAAAAMGRRISTEFEQIQKIAREKTARGD